MNLSELKNKHQGQRCFVVGNGPSLKKMDLTKLKDENVIVVNWFLLNEVYNDLNKVYHCISDRVFWSTELKMYNDFFQKFIQNKNSTLFVDEIAKDVINTELSQDLKDYDVHYLKYDREKPVWEGNFSTDITKTLCFGYTVIIDFCLPIASYLGFKDIYLIGCDCNYNLDKDHDFKESYFFSPSELPKTTLNRIRGQRDNTGSQYRSKEWNLGYEVIAKHLKKSDTSLYNAGIEVNLTTLPRVNFNDLF